MNLGPLEIAADGSAAAARHVASGGGPLGLWPKALETPTLGPEHGTAHERETVGGSVVLSRFVTVSTVISAGDVSGAGACRRAIPVLGTKDVVHRAAR
jgi:hypothetical protein